MNNSPACDLLIARLSSAKPNNSNRHAGLEATANEHFEMFVGLKVPV
jgi:hypothetical protein